MKQIYASCNKYPAPNFVPLPPPLCHAVPSGCLLFPVPPWHCLSFFLLKLPELYWALPELLGQTGSKLFNGD